MAARASEPSPAFLVRDLDQALIAAAAGAEAGTPILLFTPSDSAVALGIRWSQELARHLGREHPKAAILVVFDCADRAALAHEALRAGAAAVCFTGPPEQAQGPAEVAAALGRPFFATRPQALDLGAVPPKRRIAAAKAWIRNPPERQGVK